MARAGAPRPAVAVLFLAPGTESRDWWHGDLWRSATAIPGVRVLGDVDGRERSRFGAFTSGQAMLYGATGELLFSGGITPARCRAGDNPGRRAVAERLRAWPSSEGSTAAVFGCSLVADEPPDTGG
ncbi:hypothetical protein KF840_08790 [bacterium]|nr:hypothetical protein [bacterium]